MTQSETKRCSRCKEHKRPADFYGSQWLNGAWCKECCRLDYAGRKGTVRWQRILRDYGLSQADYAHMLDAQGGVCAICKRPERSRRFKFLAVDHDHHTTKVRGLLCHRCNAGLGNFDDAILLLREAATYLGRHAAISGSLDSSPIPGLLGVF